MPLALVAATAAWQRRPLRRPADEPACPAAAALRGAGRHRGAGGQRLLHFALVQAVCGTEALGRFANDLSIAMMLGLFSAVGWSALVLARVPVAARSAPVMLGLARGAGLFTLLACLSLPLLAWGGWVFEPAWTALLLAGWTAYTLARHYGLALAATAAAGARDVLVVLLVAGLGLFGDGRPWLAYAALAVPTALFGRRPGAAGPACPRGDARLPAAACAPPASRRPSISSAAACRWCWCRHGAGGGRGLRRPGGPDRQPDQRAAAVSAGAQLQRAAGPGAGGATRAWARCAACWAACAATCCG
jgi:hypothetical protein